MEATEFARLLRVEARKLNADFGDAPVTKIRVGKQRSPEMSGSEKGEAHPKMHTVDIFQQKESKVIEVLQSFYHEWAHVVHRFDEETGDPFGCVDESIVSFYEDRDEQMTWENSRWREDVAIAFACEQIERRWDDIKSEHGLSDDETVTVSEYVSTIEL